MGTCSDGESGKNSNHDDDDASCSRGGSTLPSEFNPEIVALWLWLMGNTNKYPNSGQTTQPNFLLQ